MRPTRSSTFVTRRLCVPVVAASLVLQSGCAAVFRESHATVYVDSVPQEADVEVDGTIVGKTPGTSLVPRQGTSVVQVKKAGYGRGNFELERSVNAGWLIADIATCVIPVLLCIPLIVDGVTGAWMDVDTGYSVMLRPEGSAGTALAPAAVQPSQAQPAQAGPAPQAPPASDEALVPAPPPPEPPPAQQPGRPATPATPANDSAPAQPAPAPGGPQPARAAPGSQPAPMDGPR